MTRPSKRKNQTKNETELRSHKDSSVDLQATAKLRERFGAWVSFVRTRLRNPKISQAEAAKLAGISRETWNRIERGKQLPAPDNIRAIAEVLKVDAAKLFRRAGYEVPLDLQIDSREKLKRDLLVCWDESTSAAEFVFAVLGIWVRDKPKDEKGGRIFLDYGFVQILGAIQQNLSGPQQLRLAKELVERTPIKDVRRERIDEGELREKIDSELDMLKRREARDLGGLYEVRSLDGMGHYNLFITDDDLTDFLMFVKNRPKTSSTSLIDDEYISIPDK
jgi:transcriptional regulator with XRE-family HTH domain